MPLQEIRASLAMENLYLTERELALLQNYAEGKIDFAALRRAVFQEASTSQAA